MDKHKLQLAIYHAAHSQGWTREQLALLAYCEGSKKFSLESFSRYQLEKVLARVETGPMVWSLVDVCAELCICDDWHTGNHEANCAWVKFCEMLEVEI